MFGWSAGGGGGGGGGNDSVVPSIQRIVQRLSTSTLLEDKRAAMLELKPFAETHKVEMSETAMPTLLSILRSEQHDLDLVRGVMDSLLLLQQGSDDDVAKTTAAITKDPSSIPTILDVLTEADWSIRLTTLKLLSSLLPLRLTAIQQAILHCPQGLMRLMDMLGDNREIIRNETLLLLVPLTSSSAEIQKYLIFEGGYDRLFEVIAQEEDGSIVGVDAISIISNLTRGSELSQRLFRESGGVRSTAHVLRGGLVEMMNIALDIVANLTIKPEGSDVSAECLVANQTAAGQQGLVETLVTLCVGPCPDGIRPKCLRSLALCIRNHEPNLLQLLNGETLQALFTLAIHCPNQDEREAGLALIHTILLANSSAQQFIASTLMPFPEGLDDADMGPPPAPARRLLPPLLGAGNVKSGDDDKAWEVWSAAIILSNTLQSNGVCQDLAVAMPLEIPRDSTPPEKLLPRLGEILRSVLGPPNPIKVDVRVQLGLLRLFCTWLAGCELGAKTLTDSATSALRLVEVVEKPSAEGGPHVPGLCALLLAIILTDLKDESISSPLAGVIVSRVGLDNFNSRLRDLQASEAFATATKRSEVGIGAPKKAKDEMQWGILLYDAQFCQLVRDVTANFQKRVLSLFASMKGEGGDFARLQQENSSLALRVAELETQNAAMIELDARLKIAELAKSQLEKERTTNNERILELEGRLATQGSEILTLTKQNSSLETALNERPPPQQIEENGAKLSQLESALAAKENELTQAMARLEEEKQKALTLQKERDEFEKQLGEEREKSSSLQNQLSSLQEEHNDLLVMLAEQGGGGGDDDDEDEEEEEGGEGEGEGEEEEKGKEGEE